MLVPKFLPELEIRKAGGNCSANCPGCSNSINNEYDTFDLKENQKIFLEKVLSVFEVNLNGKDIYGMGITFPFDFNDMSMEQFKSSVSDLSIDKIAEISYMLSSDLPSLNKNLGEILNKLKYLFDTNAEKTGRKINGTLTLSSSRGGIDKLVQDLDIGADAIKDIHLLLEGYTKQEHVLQLGRFVVKKDDFEKSKIKVKDVITNLFTKLNLPNSNIENKETDDFYENNIIINLDNNKKHIIHLGILKDSKEPEDINKHIDILKNVYSEFLLSFFDDEIQVNHALGRLNDKLNKINYEDLHVVIEEMQLLKDKLQIINLFEINNALKIFLKLDTIKNMCLVKNIAGILNNNQFNDFEKQAIFDTFTIMKDENDHLLHIEKGLFPLYTIGVYMRSKIMEIIINKTK